MIQIKNYLLVGIVSFQLMYPAGGDTQDLAVTGKEVKQVEMYNTPHLLYELKDGLKISRGEFNPEEKEHFSQLSFSQLMNTTNDGNQILLLSQSSSLDQDGIEKSFLYKAIPYMKKLFGPCFFEPELHRYAPHNTQKRDIITQQPIIGVINFFQINKQDPQKTAEYIGSDAQLHINPESEVAQRLRSCLLWNVDQTTIQTYCDAANLLGIKAAQEKNSENLLAIVKKRIAYLRLLAEDDCKGITSKVQKKSRLYLGELYTDPNNLGIKNYQMAMKFLKLVLDDNPKLLSQTEALRYAGKILYDGGYGIEKNYKEAYECFDKIEQILADADFSDAYRTQIKAQVLLDKGKILFHGDNYVSSNHKLAKELLEGAVEHTATHAESSLLLGKILLDQGSVKDAIEYIQPLTNNFNRTIAIEAQTVLDGINDLAKKGIGKDDQQITSDEVLGGDRSNKDNCLLALAYTFYDGENGSKKDFQQAKKYFKLAAQQEGDESVKLEALNRLGVLFYEGGYGVRKDFEKANYYFKQVVCQTSDLKLKADAWLILGSIYQAGGNGVEADVEKAIKYLEYAAQQNENSNAKIAALSRMGFLHIHGVNKNYQSAVQHYELVAQQDDDVALKVDALRWLGYILYKGGYGVDRDYQQAKQYLTAAYQQSSDVHLKADIARILGHIHYKGFNGANMDYKLAQQYYQFAAEQDENINAKLEGLRGLGNVGYDDGEKIGKNYALATISFEKYLDLVQKQNDLNVIADVKKLLGIMYYNGGYGIQRDYRATKNYFKSVVLQNNNPETKADAQVWLGRILGNLVNFEKKWPVTDHPRAVSYLESAAGQGNNLQARADAQRYLGYLYLIQWSPARNEPLGLQYLELASKQNDNLEAKASALFRLGCHSESKNNYDQAQVYFKQALQQGCDFPYKANAEEKIKK